MSSAYINLRPRVTGRSLVYTLNNVQAKTESRGKPFACLRKELTSSIRLPYGPGNGSFVAAVLLSECTREAGTWTVDKGGQCAKWCCMQQLGPGRLHQSSVSSQTHSQ